MYKSLLRLLLIAALTLVGSSQGQTPDGYDTLQCRSGRTVIVPVYDSIKQLQAANDKADSLLNDLEKIMAILKLNDTVR